MEYYVITKTRPGNVFFALSPIDNSSQTRIIKLTDNMPSTRLPREWALGVFTDSSIFTMYEKGYFSFGDKSADIKKAAIEEGVYFGMDGDEFVVQDNTGNDAKILETLKNSKSRTAIVELAKQYPEDVVLIARDNVDDLPTGTIKTIEDTLKVQILVED